MQEIIDKAVMGGYNLSSYVRILLEKDDDISKILLKDWVLRECLYHEFLKGYFGEGKTQCSTCASISEDETCCGDPISWQYHAQQLVLSEDKEEYLRGYLD